MEIGLNLYSLRNQIATREDFLDTLGRLKAMGYDAVQFSGQGYDPELLKSASLSIGLKVVLTHMPLGRLLDDVDALIKEHELFGCRNIGLGMMPADIADDDEKVKELAAKLEQSARRFADRGFKLFYHNHSFEFRRMGTGTVFDYLVDNTSALNFVPDTYWLQHGGVSIAGTIRRLHGRCECAHLKDYKMDGWTPRYAAVGDGNIDWSETISEMKAAGVEHFIVEQDDATEYPEPFLEIKKSVGYLIKNHKIKEA